MTAYEEITEKNATVPEVYDLSANGLSSGVSRGKRSDPD